MHWVDQDLERVRLPVLALLVGYDADASRTAGVATAVDGWPYSRAERAVLNSATGLELRIARGLLHAVDAPDLYPLLRLGIGAAGQQQFLTALTALAQPGRHPAARGQRDQERERLRADRAAALQAAFRAVILPGLTGPSRTAALAVLRRIETAAISPVPTRAEAIALLIDHLGSAGRDFHADGRPFTSAESQLIATATEQERLRAASLLHADAEIEATRLRRTSRLNQILATAPATARRGFAVDLDRTLPSPPDLDDGPLAELICYLDRYDAAFATAFRQHILPDLSPRIRAEASELLDHLDHLGDR